eukprot:scaffold3134_cov182-Amphora_coffeaeformis.AAC.12
MRISLTFGRPRSTVIANAEVALDIAKSNHSYRELHATGQYDCKAGGGKEGWLKLFLCCAGKG